MKKKLLLLLFTLIATCSYGQLYRYSYDAAGNRTIRRYSLNGMSLLNEDEEGEGEIKLSKMLQEHQVTINFSENKEVSIKVSNIDKDTQGKIVVYDTKGVQVGKATIREEETLIDMSQLSLGVYIIQVAVDGKSTSWKIAKKQM